MDNIWNQKNLKPPPVYRCKYQRLGIGQENLISICKQLEKELIVDEQFRIEAAILSKMIYKTNNKLRFDKGFQNLKKVKRCVQRYLEMNAADIVKTFSSCLPTDCCDLYMPSKQMLQYLLVRLMGLACLLHQTVLFCNTGGQFCLKRICLGQTWNLATILLGIASRLWSLCQKQVLVICKAYKELLAFLPYLTATEVSWLPSNFSFPEDLSLWLGLEKSELKSPEEIVSKMPLLSDKIFSLLTEEDEETEEMEEGDSEDAMPKRSDVSLKPRTMPAVSSSSSKLLASSKTHEVPAILPMRGIQEDEDLGESLEAPVYKIVKPDFKQKVCLINSHEDLVRFLDKELSSNNHKHMAVKGRLKGIVKGLKKNKNYKNSNFKNLSLIQNAKDILLQSNLY